jgi:hypothetical protein
MHKKTNEEFAVIVKDHMEKYQDTTRNKIKIATGISNYKLNELEDLGLVKLPPKLKAGMNTPWRNYRT